MVFDSLPSNRFTFRAKEQIASICCCKGKVVAVIKNVQNKRGASDCGLGHIYTVTILPENEKKSVYAPSVYTKTAKTILKNAII